MAKRHNFDVNEIELTAFDKTFVLMWSTQYLDYEFANNLNRLYGLQLAREIDFVYDKLEGKVEKKMMCVNYLYYDERKQLMYILIQNEVNREPLATGTESYDKILVIYGRDSRDRCMELYDEFVSGVKVEGDWDVLGREHAGLVDEVKSHGVMYVDFFDFSKEDAEEKMTSVTHTGNAKVDAKIDKRLHGIYEGVKDLLWALEEKISLEESQAIREERMANTKPQEFVMDVKGV